MRGNAWRQSREAAHLSPKVGNFFEGIEKFCSKIVGQNAIFAGMLRESEKILSSNVILGEMGVKVGKWMKKF